MLLAMVDSRKGKYPVAAHAWQLLFDFFASTRSDRDRTLESRRLTANDSRALMSLQVDEGKTMGTLAREWCCDASNATWIIDRLERLGYAERRPSPSDRRAKLVVLTSKGAKAKSDILGEFRTPPPAFLALQRDDLETLKQILEKVHLSPPVPDRRRQSTRRRSLTRRR
jgi:DNA-binding MarR family transcriptional regulator